MSTNPSPRTLAGFTLALINRLHALGRLRTADNYLAALRSFTGFTGRTDMPLADLTPDLIALYQAYLSRRNISRNTISFYMRILRAVYNRAVEFGLTRQRHPFRSVYTGIDKTVKRAIPLAAIRRIKNLDLSAAPALDLARDLFLFSFYTRGMAFIDMAYLGKNSLRNGILTYRRRKTGQLLSIRWETCMQEIVAKHSRLTLRSPYLLPILHNAGADSAASRYRSALQQTNKALKTISALAGLDHGLTTYVARHSWASVAKAKNIPLSVISEGMGHDSESTTKIYLASLDTAVIDTANRLILRDL